jgi:DNA-binding LytR/AlgR family response regulator
MDNNKTNLNKCLRLKVADGIRFIPFEDIVRIEANNKKIFVFINSNVNPTEGYGKMSDISKQLDESNFFCCHRSHIINLKYIVKYLSKSSKLVTKQGIVPLSERKAYSFRNSIMNKI